MSRWALLACAAAITTAACEPDNVNDTREIVEATAGDTCGYWASRDHQDSGAVCGEGLWCMPEVVPERDSSDFGLCIDTSTDCSGGGTECPDGWGCASQSRNDMDVCLKFCSSHADCDSAFQACDFMTPGTGYCRVRPCLDAPDEECPDGTACEQGLCLPPA
jgi:hypothetical protein